MKRKKLLFVSRALAGGGAERIISLLLKHINRNRFQPVLVVFQNRLDFPVPEDVKVICFNKKGVSALPGLIRNLARVYEEERPEAVFSTIDYPNLITVLAKKLSRAKPKLLLQVVNHTSTVLKRGFFCRLQAAAIPYLYPKADVIICLSRGVASDLVAKFNIRPEKIEVIHGQVDIDCISSLAKEPLEESNFIPKGTPIIAAMGRLVEQKGYEYLLRAFTQTAAEVPCHLVILGEGKKRIALQNLAKELKIDSQVTFLGFQHNPFKYLARSDIFVLSSLWEGFALAIIEAMACGIPVISTRCPSGPEEIITDGINGLLVPVADVKALAEAMLRLLKNRELRTKLAEAERRRAKNFSIEKITREYERFI